MTVIAVAAPPEVRDLFFDADTWAALRRLGDVRLPPPEADVGDEATLAALLAGADVVVTGWGARRCRPPCWPPRPDCGCSPTPERASNRS